MVSFLLSVLQLLKIVNFGGGFIGLLIQLAVLVSTIVAVIVGGTVMQIVKNNSVYGHWLTLNLVPSTSPVNTHYEYIWAWTFGAGTAVAAVIVATFHFFVLFRHYAMDTRKAAELTGAEAKDQSAA